MLASATLCFVGGRKKKITRARHRILQWFNIKCVCVFTAATVTTASMYCNGLLLETHAGSTDTADTAVTAC